MLDDRPVAATLLFLPNSKNGDVDNYLKGIIDGMDRVFASSLFGVGGNDRSCLSTDVFRFG
jgi:hypothetical protein